MTMRRLLPVCFLLLLAIPVAAQQPAGPAGRRRAQLETQLLQQFARQAGQELQLDDAGRARLGRIVQEVAAERRNLNASALDLRRRLQLAVRDSTTTDAQFVQLLRQQGALRQREHQLWQREQNRLSQVLTPRQRAHFTLLWLRLQDDARGLMMQRGLGPRAGLGG